MPSVHFVATLLYIFFLSLRYGGGGGGGARCESGLSVLEFIYLRILLNYRKDHMRHRLWSIVYELLLSVLTL